MSAGSRARRRAFAFIAGERLQRDFRFVRYQSPIRLSGGFGGEPGSGAPLVLPEILRQNLGLFQCFYGAEEEYTLCRAPELAGAEIIRTGGGHHFDGDYRALAEKILDGAARRLAAAGDTTSLVRILR